jgi:hypothetical protein
MTTGRIVLLITAMLCATLHEAAAQRRGYVDNFDNGSLESGRRSGQNQRPPYLLWRTVTPGTYALAENDGVLRIGYKKH